MIKEFGVSWNPTLLEQEVKNNGAVMFTDTMPWNWFDDGVWAIQFEKCIGLGSIYKRIYVKKAAIVSDPTGTERMLIAELKAWLKEIE